MLDKRLLEKLYTSYGFEVESSNEKDISIFLYKKSRYFGVDIIPTATGSIIYERAEEIKDAYSKLGYAASLKKIQSNEDAEMELFKSFFAFDSSLQRINRKYQEFKSKQTHSLLGNEYEYVESPFELHNHNDDEKQLFQIIESRLSSEIPELIIIEAAAGYGKTCTAFEVLHKVIAKEKSQLPIFTELARNRSANIFRYILLDEIDLEFPSLNSNLVIKEIKNGRIPLIIDGFDELLEKVNVDSVIDSSFDDVESMLDTIGTLLENRAKIILTTRKTAIFTGLEFEKWLQKWTDKFSLTRIALKEPRIKDWLGTEKYDLVQQKNVPIQNLANPVLLTFLKNLKNPDFNVLIEAPDQLVQHYFEKMLEREKERQDLIMTVENQLQLFRNVAKNLLELDSTVEEKDFFKLIILEDNKRLLEETKNLYSGGSNRTVDNLVDTLCTHALLDRKGRDQNQIGFINDFVFGTFLGDILISQGSQLTAKRYSSYMVELAVTAFRVQNVEKKSSLWETVQTIADRFQIENLFLFDVYLKEKLERDYSEITIHDASFFNVSFRHYSLTSSVFINCYFKDCIFDSKTFHGVTFINCTFSNCKVENEQFLDFDNEVTAIKCKQERCEILLQFDSTHYEMEETALVSEFEKQVLEKLWSISHTKGHHITKLMNSIEKPDRRKIHRVLKSLQELGFLDVRGAHLYLPINKINTIKKIIGLG